MTNFSSEAEHEKSRQSGIIEAVMQRDDRTCQMCGSAEGDKCFFDERPISLQVITILPPRLGGRFEEDNLKSVCSSCATGMLAIENRARKSGNIEIPPRKGRIELLTQIRRASREDQKAVGDWLSNKFKTHVSPNE